MIKDMTSGKTTSVLIRFTVPLVLGNLLQLTYNAVDSAIVGNYVGTKGLAAVGCTNPLMNLAILFISGMCMGAGILMSMSFGSGDTARLRRLLSTSMLGGAVFCLIVTVLGIIFTPALLHLIRVPEEIMPEASGYLRIIFTALIFTFLYNFLASSMRALGDSRTPLIFLGISAVLNVIGDLFFIIVLHAGVHGAAIATVLSEILCTLCCTVYILLRLPALHLGRSWFLFDAPLFREIVAFSITSALQQACLQVGKIMIQSIADTMGTAVVAAFGIINRVDDFAYTPQQNIGHAMTTFLAQNKVAGKNERINRGFKSGMLIEFAYTVLLCILCYFGAPFIVRLFIGSSGSTDTAEVMKNSVRYLHLIALMYFLPAFTNGIQGFFRGMGDLKITLLSTFMNMVGRVLTAFLLAFSFHLQIETFAYANFAGWILMILFEFPLLCRHLHKQR